MSTESILVKTFEIYAAPSHFAPDPLLTIKEIPPTREHTEGHLWQVAFPFDAWVWESDFTAFQAKPATASNWKANYSDFPSDLKPRYTWELAFLPRKGKKIAECLTEHEAALAEWLFEDGPPMNVEERRDAWRARTDVGEEAFVFGHVRGVCTGSKVPSRSFICYLLQRLNLEEMDKTISELTQKTSGKLDNLFKVTPARLLQHSALADLSTKISSTRLYFESVVEPVFSSRKFFHLQSDRKFYTTLVDELDMEDEIETLSDRLETLEDIYEVMGERVTEYRYFLTEAILELLIIFILLWEIWVMYEELNAHLVD